MKKKLLAFLFVIAAACALALGFTACDLTDTGDKNGGEHEHTVKKYEAKAASCKEEGRREYWYCNSCGKFYSDADCENEIKYSDTVIAKTSHTVVVDTAVAKTCTTDGKTEGKHCSVCNTVIVAQKVIPASHTEIVFAKAVPATCTTEGKTEGRRCSKCNTVTQSPTTVPKAGHTEVIDAAVPATCTTPGKTEGKHCSVCNAVTVAQKTIPVSHTEVYDKAIPATCTTDGKTGGMHCSKCGFIIVEQLIVKAGHKEVIDEAVEATCTTDGKTEGKHCSVCNEVLVEQTVIPASHFEVVDLAVTATCTTAGKTKGVHCLVCNAVLLAQTGIPALGHNTVTDEAVPATCVSDGKTEGSHCSRCNLVFVAQQTITKTGHSGSGKLCTTCGGLRVSASTGLAFRELTAMPTGYSLRSGSVDVIGYEVTGKGSFNGTNLVIPETHNGLPVLGIADSAFFQNSTINSVTIPNGIIYIGDASFYQCTNLYEVNIADSVTVIKDSAFSFCAITSFKCPENLNKFPTKLFTNDTSLVWVTVPEGITEITAIPFTGCTALSDIYFEGTEGRWNQVVSGWNNITATVNFYSETQPTAAGNYWHYVNGNPVKW